MTQLPHHEQIQAYLLGPLMLRYQEETIPLPSTSISCSLLAYLLLHRQRLHPRTVLVDLFWPNQSEAKGRRALSQTLWYIRTALPLDDIIQANNETITIPPQAPIWVDAILFDTLLAPYLETPFITPDKADNIRQAINLYRGELLLGTYDEWLRPKRERFHTLYMQGLSYLITIEKQAGHYRQALDVALIRIEADPFRESSYHEAIRLYLALNQPDAAFKQFEACRQCLEGIGLTLSAKTMALGKEVKEQLHNSKPYLDHKKPKRQQVPTFSHIPFVSREEERQQLLDQVIQLFDEVGGVFLIAGEAGVGKTRLMQEVADDAAWHGTQVLWGRCLEMQTAVPLSPLTQAISNGLSQLMTVQLAQTIDLIWLQILKQFVPHLSKWLPTLTAPPTLEPKQAQERLREALLQTLQAWGYHTPLLLILDDIQWADADTLAFLPTLAKRLYQSRVLLVALYRHAEVNADPYLKKQIRATTQAGVRGHLALSRLTNVATNQLIRRILTTFPPLLSQQIYRETEGNPLFIIETLRTLQDQDLLENTSTATALPLPQTIEQLLQQRLKLLLPSLRHLLDIMAVLGRYIDYKLLATVSGLEDVQLLTALGRLQRWHYLEQTDDAYQFSHNKIRQVAYQQLPSQQRQQLHIQIAQAIQTHQPDNIDLLAYHYTQGQQWSQAITYTIQVAQRAQSAYAYHVAQAQYTQALTLLNNYQPFDPVQNKELEFDILLAQQAHLIIHGDAAAQEETLTKLTQLAYDLEQPTKWVKLFNEKALFWDKVRSEHDKARHWAKQALTLAQEHHLFYDMIRALYIIGETYITNNHYLEAEKWLLQALTLWQQLPPLTTGQTSPVSLTDIAMLHYSLAVSYWRRGLLAEAEVKCQEIIQLAGNDPYAMACAYNVMALLADDRKVLEESLQHNQQGLKYVRIAGSRRLESVLLANRGFTFSLVPHYGQAVDTIQQALNIHHQLEDQYNKTVANCHLATIYQSVGQYNKAEPLLQQGLTQARKLKMTIWEVIFLTKLGSLYLTKTTPKDVAQAANYLMTAKQLVEPLQTLYEEAEIYFWLALASQAQKEDSKVLILLEQALAIADKGYNIDCMALCHSYLALYHLNRGQSIIALNLSQKALEPFLYHQTHQILPRLYYHRWLVLDAAQQTAAAHTALDQAYNSLQTQKATLPDPNWTTNFLNISLNRTIITTYTQMQNTLKAGQITLQLPSIDSPQRGPLPPEQLITVTWTINSPLDQEISNKKKRRHHQLLRLFSEAQAQGALPTTDDLAQALDASRATIRRDLQVLRQNGYTLITRGRRN